MLLPKDKSSWRHPKEKTTPHSSNPGINRRGFRRSPHLQAVMDRIEERKQSDREKEIRGQAISRKRWDHQERTKGSKTNLGEGDDEEGELSHVLEVFAKYDNMLENLVLKNMELVSLAEKKSRKIQDDENVLTEKVLKDLRTLRQMREEQLEHEPFQHFSLPEDEDKDLSTRNTRNLYLQFNKPNELLEDKKQTSSSRGARFSPVSTSPTPSSGNRKQFMISDEEIIDTFRPPRKSTTETIVVPEAKESLDNNQSRIRKIRELRERHRKRKEAKFRKYEGATNKGMKRKVNENLSRRKDQSEIREGPKESKSKTKGKRPTAPSHRVKTNTSNVEGNWDKNTVPASYRDPQHRLGEAEALHKELEEMWCICPLDLPPESNQRIPRRACKVVTEIDSQTDESENESFGPSREARRLKERLGKIAKQSKSLKHAQDEMRGEMLQLQLGYKQKHKKLKRKFLRNTAPLKETREHEYFFTPSGVRAHQDESINYEVRDGIIVLDDIEDDTDIAEYEFLGVQNPHHEPGLSGGNSYMAGPVVHAPDEIHEYRYTDQTFMQQPVMELPYTSEDHDIQGAAVLRAHGHRQNRSGGNDSDDEDSLSYDAQSTYTQEHYRTSREPV